MAKLAAQKFGKDSKALWGKKLCNALCAANSPKKCRKAACQQGFLR
jgi:hypothetical protein